MLSSINALFLALLVPCLAITPQPLNPEQAKRLTAVYDAYVGQNLSYDCFPYADHNSIAECDCLACVAVQPDLVQRLCRFRDAQARLYEGKPILTQRDSKDVWKAMCDPKCSSRLPSKCCDPTVTSVPMEQGCPVCLPTRESGSTVGQHPSCFLAETDATKKPSDLNWIERYSRFMAAMDKAQLSRKCASYALFYNAKPCDCEPCLQSESSTRTLREKICEYGRLVRSTPELLRPDFWKEEDYFLKFCDFDACPEIPRKCCAPHGGSEGKDGRYPVDGKGCPACLHTTVLFGFGPRCQRKFQRLPTEVRERLVSHF